MLQQVGMFFLEHAQFVGLLAFPPLVLSEYVGLDLQLALEILQFAASADQLVLGLPPLLVQLRVVVHALNGRLRRMDGLLHLSDAVV